jgi:cytoskeletal protein CcmA (bactofilin family)
MAFLPFLGKTGRSNRQGGLLSEKIEAQTYHSRARQVNLTRELTFGGRDSYNAPMPRPEEINRPAESPPSLPSAAARVGPSCVVHGELEAKEDFVIQGTFQGTISLPANTLYVDKQGEVLAKVVAASVILLGKLEGDIHASGRVFVAAGAKMKGDIVARRISLQDGAQFRGSIKIESEP